MGNNTKDYFINRFGEKNEDKKPEGLAFHFSMGDVVCSASMGMCMIQGYGIYDNTYWCENGQWEQASYRGDIERLPTETERASFLNGYLKLFTEFTDKFYPAGDGHREKMIGHKNLVLSIYEKLNSQL